MHFRLRILDSFFIIVCFFCIVFFFFFFFLSFFQLLYVYVFCFYGPLFSSPLLGQLSVAHTETFNTRNVKPSGRRRLSLSALHLVVCRSRSTPPWVMDMDMCRCRRSSMLQNFIVILTRRSPESVRPPLTLHSRVMSPHHHTHTANFRLFASSPMMTSSLPSANFRTSSAPQTRFQLTNLLKDNVDVLAPFITELINRSMTSGVFPSYFKAAFITPLLKKPNLDPSDGKSYRPISNLSVLSNQNHSL